MRNKSDFQLRRGSNISKKSILTDIIRVDKLLNKNTLTKTDYSKHSRVCSRTVLKYFNSWYEALMAAGLKRKSTGRIKTEKQINQHGKYMSDEDIIKELKRIAKKIGKNTISRAEVNKISDKINYMTIRRRLGWNEALKRAGLKMKGNGKRYSDEECFENLQNVWIHYGRPPHAKEMNTYPSTVGCKAYERWGCWAEALKAFRKEVSRHRVGNKLRVRFFIPAPTVKKRVKVR